MKTKTLGGLAALIAGFAGLAYWDELQTVKDKEAARVKNLLVSVPLDSITSFKITKKTDDSLGNKPPLSFVLKGESWRMISPIETNADQRVVANFLKSATEYKFHKIVSNSKGDWGKFGVGENAKKIEIMHYEKGSSAEFDKSSQKKLTTTIYIGNKAPIGYSIYSRTGMDDRVYIGSQYLETVAGKKLAEFREKLFVKIDEATTTKLNYHMRLQAPVTLVKENGAFKIASSNLEMADEVEVSSLIRALKKANAVAYADAPIPKELASKLTERAAAYKISWTDKNGPSKKLLIGRFHGKLWAVQETESKEIQVAYKLTDSFEAKIRKVPDDFKNRRLFSFDSSELKSIKLNSEQFEESENQWFLKSESITSKKNTASPLDRIRSLVVDLEFVKTSEFIAIFSPSYRNIQAEKPVHELILRFKDEAKPDIFIQAWDSKKKDQYLLKVSDRDYLYLISKDIIDANLVRASLINTDENGSLEDRSSHDKLPDLELESKNKSSGSKTSEGTAKKTSFGIGDTGQEKG